MLCTLFSACYNVKVVRILEGVESCSHTWRSYVNRSKKG
jgi:hypothetical protein